MVFVVSSSESPPHLEEEYDVRARWQLSLGFDRDTAVMTDLYGFLSLVGAESAGVEGRRSRLLATAREARMGCSDREWQRLGQA
jgi:hypothetical protein